jgi:ornithine cyclodeaminase
MTDLDAALIDYSDKFVVDDMHCTLKRISAMAGLEIDESKVYGDICQIACGAKPARQSDNELITYTPSGMGAIDLAVALAAYQKTADNAQKFALL